MQIILYFTTHIVVLGVLFGNHMEIRTYSTLGVLLAVLVLFPHTSELQVKRDFATSAALKKYFLY